MMLLNRLACFSLTGFWNLLFFAIILFCCFSKSALAEEDHPPFYPGEKMTFQLKWSFITAGEAVIKVLPMEHLDGVKAFHIVYSGRTSPYVDLFYKVRDTVDSYIDAEVTHSLLYKKLQQGKSQRDITVRFDWAENQALFSDSGKKSKPISIFPGTFDPLSVFYSFRLHDLEKYKEFETPVTDGKNCVMGKVRVIKRETIKVEGTSYDTYLVEPDLKDLRGVFKKSKGAALKIWVTADERCIPVRIKSKVIVGSFLADLVSFEAGTPEVFDSQL